MADKNVGRKRAAAKKRRRKGNAKVVAFAMKPAESPHEWDILLSGRESTVARANAWANARIHEAGSTPAEPEGSIEASFGVAWVDPTFPVFYHVLVNGIDIGAPRDATGGRIVREIALEPGENRLDWSIRHTGQGWKNAVFLKVNGKVFKLNEDSDPSAGTDDDVSSKTVVFTI